MREETFYFERGATFFVGDKRYVLVRSFGLKVNVWGGACAGSYITDPVRAKIVNLGVPLEASDVREEVYGFISSLAEKEEALGRLQEPQGQDKRELEALRGLFALAA